MFDVLDVIGLFDVFGEFDVFRVFDVFGVKPPQFLVCLWEVLQPPVEK